MNNRAIIRTASTALLGIAACCALTSYADDSKFSLYSGIDYSSGKYQSGPWAFKLTAPTALAGGVGNLTPSQGRLLSGDSRPVLGDTEAAATYSLYPSTGSSFGLDLTGKVKLNLADRYFGLTTIQNDYAAQADAYQRFDRFKALGSVGYKFLGNSEGLNINRILYGSVGGSYQMTDQMTGGLDFSLAQSPTATDPGTKQLSAHIDHSINKNFTAKGYLLKNFSNNSSPDHTLGASVSYGF